MYIVFEMHIVTLCVFHVFFMFHDLFMACANFVGGYFLCSTIFKHMNFIDSYVTRVLLRDGAFVAKLVQDTTLDDKQGLTFIYV